MARKPRSVPGVGLGDHVAANPRGGGDRALSQISAALSDGAETRSSAGRLSAGGVERAGILSARAHAPCGGESGGARARGRVSGDGGGVANPAGGWTVYGGGDCQHRSWGSRRGGRRERRARAAADL